MAKKPVFLDFEGESDRAVAVLSAAFLDHELEVLLRGFLRDTGETESLFSPMQPLASFGARAKLAYVLGLIGEEAHDDLNRIRKVRNIFAHDRQPRRFTDQDIHDHCRAFRLVEVTMGHHPQKPIEPRARFKTVTMMLLGAFHTYQYSTRDDNRRTQGQPSFDSERHYTSDHVEYFAVREGQDVRERSVSLTVDGRDRRFSIRWRTRPPLRDLISLLTELEEHLPE